MNLIKNLKRKQKRSTIKPKNKKAGFANEQTIDVENLGITVTGCADSLSFYSL